MYAQLRVRRERNTKPRHSRGVPLRSIQCDRFRYWPQRRKGGVRISTPPNNQEWIDSSRRLASLRLNCFLLTFRGEFLGHCFLKLLRIHSVAFGGVHENVVAASSGSLIRRI